MLPFWVNVTFLVANVMFFSGYFWSFDQKTVLGCACFPEFLQNFSERQILWSLCWLVFIVFTLKSPIQTLLPVAPKLLVCVRSGEKCQNLGKQAHASRKKHNLHH